MQGGVYNHNELRYDCGSKYQIVLDVIWGTTWWPIRVIPFFLACTEVNSYLALKYFLLTDEAFIKFWKNWIWHWFTTHIPMNNHVVSQQTWERDRYHTFWRLHRPMLLNMMSKKGVAMQYLDARNTSAISQIVKK